MGDNWIHPTHIAFWHYDVIFLSADNGKYIFIGLLKGKTWVLGVFAKKKKPQINKNRKTKARTIQENKVTGINFEQMCSNLLSFALINPVSKEWGKKQKKNIGFFRRLISPWRGPHSRYS